MPRLNTPLCFDEGARALPGPEILPVLDAGEYIANRLHILAVPGDPSCVARLYPKWGIEDTPQNREGLHIARANLLAHCGVITVAAEGVLRVPNFNSFIALLPSHVRQDRRLSPTDQRVKDELALVTVVEYIDSPPLNNAGTDPEGAACIYGISKYLERILSNDLRVMFSDIYTPDQYLGNYVADIEPQTCTPSRGFFIKTLHLLQEWHSRLPDPSEDFAASAGEFLTSLAVRAQARPSTLYRRHL